jgi:peptidoglycan/xylan/chitin deacetylase (PgdA/CDA1 family)
VTAAAAVLASTIYGCQWGRTQKESQLKHGNFVTESEVFFIMPNHRSSPLPPLNSWARLSLGWVLLGLMLVGQVSCNRIKEKLSRLAAVGNEAKPVEPEQPPLSEEEAKLNAVLKNPELFADVPTAIPVAVPVPFELNKSSVVSILGYHDFREKGGEAMVINQTKFREQMLFIKESNIPVISLEDVLAWKHGEKNIPDEAFVITMDDGWQGVHRYAFPVLKEFGFPFTVYLYKNYVNSGGRSMTWAEIQEMIDSGLCTIGSHSISHDSLTARKGRSDEDYEAYLLEELKVSKDFLEENLKRPITSFAYPYGNYNSYIRDLGMEVGYDSLVTVNGSKVNWNTHLGDLGRFIIHGVNDSVFKLATSFRGRGSIDSSKMTLATAMNEQGQPLVNLSPAIGTVIKERLPLLEADLSGLGPIKPESVKIHIAGGGSGVPQYDAATQVLRYQVPIRLRREQCDVTISFIKEGSTQTETLVWPLRIDLGASYLPTVDAIPVQP